MHKDRDDRDGKLIAGPIWDFNLSFGKAWFSDDLYVTEGWQFDYDTTHPDDEYKVPFWWEKLGADTVFMDQVKVRWQQLRKDPITEDSLFKTIDTWTEYLEEARIRNFTQWPEALEDHTYEEEIQWLKEWITDRIAWMDQELFIIVPIVSGVQNIKLSNSFKLINTSKTSKIIRFGLSGKSWVKIILFTVSGKKVSTLLNSEKGKGFHTIEFDPAFLPSGVYFCALQTSTWSDVMKVELVQ